MRAASARSGLYDPYRAGLELGEQLAGIAPEVVFVFSSIHYASPELLEGLYDGLQHDEVIVVGNTGDGCYESSGACDQGVAALALNSGGEVRWRLECIESADSLAERLKDLAAALSAGGEAPALAYLAADFRCDAGIIESALRDDMPFPVIGGRAGDDWSMARCSIYANRRMLEGALAMLAAYGNLRFSISVGNALRPIGRSGMLEEAGVMQIHRIDGLPATAFVEREMGKPILLADHGRVALQVRTPGDSREQVLRSVKPEPAAGPGFLGLFGPISAGYEVQICLPTPDDLLDDVALVVRRAVERATTPVAALLVSCTGRKSVLGHQVGQEVALLQGALKASLPLAGFPSFGEIGPLRHEAGYTRNLLHNMTYILLLIDA